MSLRRLLNITGYALAFTALAACVAPSAERPRVEAPCVAPPDSGTLRLAAAELKQLAGRYTLTLVATQGHNNDTLARGTLELWEPDSAYAQISVGRGEPMTSPLHGATDIDINALAPVSVSYPPSSRDPEAPGVQMLQDGTLIFGNAMTPRGAATDAGIIFFFQAVDSTGFKGHWVNGGLTLVGRQLSAGYYCAVRQSAPAT